MEYSTFLCRYLPRCWRCLSSISASQSHFDLSCLTLSLSHVTTTVSHVSQQLFSLPLAFSQRLLDLATSTPPSTRLSRAYLTWRLLISWLSLIVLPQPYAETSQCKIHKAMTVGDKHDNDDWLMKNAWNYAGQLLTILFLARILHTHAGISHNFLHSFLAS